MAGAVALAGGVTGFVLAAHPHGGRTDNVPVDRWLLTGVVAAVVIVGLVAIAWRRHGDSRAVLLGLATGTAYGLQDGLTRDVYGLFSHRGAAAFGGWQLWALVVVGALGVLMAQNAFDCAPLTSSLPAISITEPLVGIVLGVALFDSHVRTTWLALVIALSSLAVMFVGAFFVSRARIVREATAPAQSTASLRAA